MEASSIPSKPPLSVNITTLCAHIQKLGEDVKAADQVLEEAMQHSCALHFAKGIIKAVMQEAIEGSLSFPCKFFYRARVASEVPPNYGAPSIGDALMPELPVGAVVQNSIVDHPVLMKELEDGGFRVSLPEGAISHHALAAVIVNVTA
eukprot:TRINITY_DN46184_c0_g1_i1.p1 TRINITY_DN46184_c0_g1~~TRINITY_DN46184_c0_g1_i1.p1  ORF type:complete len:167 (-),score=28.08 TRINITY_DN46184_c0_g1_i1:97-540(-)